MFSDHGLRQVACGEKMAFFERCHAIRSLLIFPQRNTLVPLQMTLQLMCVCPTKNFSKPIPILRLVSNPQWILNRRQELYRATEFLPSNFHKFVNCRISCKNNKPVEALTDADGLHEPETDNS